MALSDNKLRQNFGRGMGPLPLPVKADAVIYQGALVVVATGEGLAYPAEVDTGLVCLGIAEYAVDATGKADGELFVHVCPGRWSGFSSAVAPDNVVSPDHIGQTVYLVDDNTVASNDGTGTRSAAGVYLGNDDRGKLIVSIAGQI